MAKALQLTIKRPNGKTYTVPITPLQIDWSKYTDQNYRYGSYSKDVIGNNIAIVKQLDSIQPVALALELPEKWENNYNERWIINNIPIDVNFMKKNYSSFNDYYVQIYKYQKFNVRIHMIDDTSIEYNAAYLTNHLSSSATCFTYDYSTGLYGYLEGVQAFTPTDISDNYINSFKIEYSEELFRYGVNPPYKEDKTFTLNQRYNTNPCSGRSKAGITQTSFQSWVLGNIEYNHDSEGLTDLTRMIRWLNDQPNADKIPEPPKYPDNPDDDEEPDDNPTDPTPGPGDGTSDPIPVPPKPSTDVTGTGFVTLYNPSPIEIRDLAYFMWSGDFADILKKIFQAPFDCLIGLKLLYAPLSTGASQTIWLGNVETTVSAPKITDQFIDFDCGKLVIAEYFGSFLDYTPYTKITIFLPFIGYKQLNVDEIMNSTLHLTYRIDVYSGACIAFIKVTKTIKTTNLNSILYSFDGNCAMDIPFTAEDMSRYVAAILGTAASTAGAVISNPMPSEAPLNTETDATKNPNEKHLSDLGNTSANLVASKPQIQRGGSLAGANSSMGIKQPYIIIERPMQQMPYNYPNYIGIPLNMTKTLSQVTGFTVISDVFMASSQATDEEIKMITSKLKQGVVF